MEQQQKPQKHFGFRIIHPNSAGIDVGSMEMYVSMPNSEGIPEVKVFKAFTDDLKQLAIELKQAQVTHVAMEATGVYWMAIFEILEQAGLHVTLVNAHHFKNTEAQKTDVKDCQWLHQLHAHGFLHPSHVADENYRQLRTYIHERNVLQKQKGDGLNRIQRALTQMNLKVQHLISDLEGVSGMKIIRAIARGIQQPEQLLLEVNIKILKATKDDLIKSLTGNYKEHHVQVVKNQLAMYDFIKLQMQEYEKLIEEKLRSLLPVDQEGNKPVIGEKKTKARKNQYNFNLKEYLKQLTEVDLTAIDGVDEITILTLLAIVGLDFKKWPTAEHFVSWLNLAARPKISGGKVLGYQKRYTHNPATQALRMAAQSLWNSKSPLGHLYRRLAATKGIKKAIKAVAGRLAKIIYKMMINKTAYNPLIVVENPELKKAKKIIHLKKEAAKLGLVLIPAIAS